MTREELVNVIRTKGWNKDTKQLTREVFVNEPTNRFSFYDLYKVFHSDGHSVDEVANAIMSAPHFTKDEESHRYPAKNVVESTQEMNRSFNDGEEMIEFWCGTSRTRAMAFLKNGDGYTALERPVQLHNGTVTSYGIQVMLSDSRADRYAATQAGATMDKPYVIHGLIKAKYLYPANNGYEYAIPCAYHKYIAEGCQE